MENHVHDTADNALVEISLALAMAFFALLVVALVSIATPKLDAEGAIEHRAGVLDELGLTAQVVADTPSTASSPRFLLHHRGHWFDLKGDAVEPNTLATDERRVVVALSPTLTLAEARTAQNAVHHLDAAPTLTTLTPEWIARLEQTR